MMAYLSLKKENIWNIDPKNELGYWFVAGSYGTMSEMYKSLHRIFEKIIDIGTISKIVYPTPYDSNLASMVIEKIKISNQSFYQNIFSDLSYSDFNFFQNTLFDVYLNQEIKPMVFNLYNKQDNLEALNHPAKENGRNSNLSPFTINLSLSEKNKYFELVFKIYTDIYFPYVLCPWKWKEKYDDKDETGPRLDEIDYSIHGFDNRELSFLNGKRLNYFLTELKSFVDAFEGMQWENFETEHWLGYHKMVNETGINLSYS